MVPIHDSDIAEERWSKAEWEHYELWEKIEQRLRRRRSWWIAGTIALFLALSSIPIVSDRWPKWVTLSVGRTLAQEISRMKRLASAEHAAYRLRFAGDGSLRYQVERLPHCGDGVMGTLAYEGTVENRWTHGRYLMLTSQRGLEIGVPGLINDFCYDALSGADTVTKPGALAGFGIIPMLDEGAKNVTVSELRVDRLTVVFVSGDSAEISFE